MELGTIKLLEKIEESRSYKKKFSVAQSNSNNKQFKKVFFYTYSPKYKYNIKVGKYDEYSYQKNPKLDTREKRWEYFEDLVDRLNSRKISGNTAKDIVERFLRSVSDKERKWYCRILNRDLRIGLGPTSLKKIWMNIVPDIEVQLATFYKKGMEFPDNIILEPKIDGLRCLTFITRDHVECYSRNGERFYHYEDFISDAFKNDDSNVVLDGELFYQTWNKTLSAVQSGSGIENIIYYTFDLLTQNEYFNRSTENLSTRKKRLESFIQNYSGNGLTRTEVHPIESRKSEIMGFFQKYIRSGYEGVIVKDLDSKYKFDRTKDWIKIKAQDYDVFLCVDVKEGTGENKGKLGSLIVEDKKGNRIGVGQGSSDKQREEFWKNPPIGKYIEISFLTSKHKKSVARNPVFIRVREDIS